jgi:hypothetical protein
MKMDAGTLLSGVCLVLGVGFYVAGVAGFLWTKTAPGDVGLLSTSAVFVLFGVLGLVLKKAQAPPPQA